MIDVWLIGTVLRDDTQIINATIRTTANSRFDYSFLNILPPCNSEERDKAVGDGK